MSGDIVVDELQAFIDHLVQKCAADHTTALQVTLSHPISPLTPPPLPPPLMHMVMVPSIPPFD
jgi:hypothetical protein